jgi:hypothetical protein
VWIGARRRHGGGERPALSFWVPGKGSRKKNAARVMCELVHGPAPTPEHEASHLCTDEWLCICPDHLAWETRVENEARKRRDPSIFAGVRADPNHIPF